MKKIFNTHGDCQPQLHYMVDLSSRLQKIKAMVDAGQYFTINRARQYGKTTTLLALGEFLHEDYTVISLDFQLISQADFETEERFVAAFSREILDSAADIPASILDRLSFFAKLPAENENITLSVLFKTLMEWCKISTKELVLIIDEVDNASNNQVFLDFLSQLRGYYLKRRRIKTFQSVILASVYDIKSIRGKVSLDEAHKFNSPWNIAADFLVDMNFSENEIAGMLSDYEDDCRTGMDIPLIAGLLFAYTSGYPFLVSQLCKLMDEQIAGSPEFPDKHCAWTKPGFLAAVRMLLSESNTLFDSLLQKLEDYPELSQLLQDLLFKGQEISYSIGVRSIEIALMFGFVKISASQVLIANRIFETLLYNHFLILPKMQKNAMITTLEEYETLPEDARAEIFDGQIYYMASPSQEHQTISTELTTIINSYIKNSKGPCKVFHAPFDVKLSDKPLTIVQPDLMIVCDKNKLDGKRCNGAPDFIIEIISPGNPSDDYIRKLYYYKNAGVREYWIVDPRRKIVTVNYFEGNKLNIQYSFDSTIKVNIYNDLLINFSEIAELLG